MIYKSTCKTNNKVYIGETIAEFKWRIWEHNHYAKSKKKKNKFHNALCKYGENDFAWEILETIEETDPQKMHDKLDEREKFWIDHYDSIKNGYNTVYGSPIRIGNNIGKNNPAYVKINIDENEYFKKAAEGLNRQQLAKYFGIPERHMKIWRKRMCDKDPLNKLAFMNLDSERKKKSAEHNKAINKYVHHIENIKTMVSLNISMREISKQLNIPFVAVNRIIHRDLKVQ